MIKIIKRGKKVKEQPKTYTLTCPKCGCVFKCEKKDTAIFVYGSVGVKPNKIWNRAISCPCCKKGIGIMFDNNEITEVGSVEWIEENQNVNKSVILFGD